jgi:hypothetical protein
MKALAAVAAMTAASATSPFLPNAPFPPQQLVVYGRVVSLVPSGRAYRMRFDPALFLSGRTANVAAADDGVIPRGQVVPNDHYVRDTDHKLLTFVVPTGAHATVVTSGPHALAVPVSELAQIVRGLNPKHRVLFEPKNPFWIRLDPNDTVLSLDQEYSP